MKISVLDKRGSCVLGSMTSMATVTLEEKRLKALKQQLFGKEQTDSREVPKRSLPDKPQIQNFKHSTLQTTALDPISLKTDLMKIISLSALAILIQLSLFFAFKSGLIHIF